LRALGIMARRCTETGMPLQSKLLRGDPKLQACLVSDPAHVTPGSRGDHVGRIQIALNQLSGAALHVDGVYGQKTAQAVMDYKNDPSRRILQPFQKTADNIVGKRTIASLDDEMLKKEKAPVNGFRIIVLSPPPRSAVAVPAVQRSALTLAFKLPAVFADIVPGPVINPPLPSQSIRLKPRDTAELLVKNPGGNTIVHCINNPIPGGSCFDKISWLWDPDLPQTDRLAPEPTGQARANIPGPNVIPVEFDGQVNGNRFFLVRAEDKRLNLDGFCPGDATIIATNAVGQQSTVQVVVRAISDGPVKRDPLKVLAPGSRFFSAANAEFDPAGLGDGRPVNPRRGGKLINLGGETETPEFEDYQVSLQHSGYARGFTKNKFVFRPLVDDPDPSVRIADQSASHICMRGSPLRPFVAAIKRIARPGCLLTFSGADAPRVKAELGGTVLEETPDRVAIEL
jgi:hypothetical protein